MLARLLPYHLLLYPKLPPSSYDPLFLDTYFSLSFSLSSSSLLFCFSHGQIQSAGHGQSTPFFLCSDLFQMPLAVLALISTIKTFPLTTPWKEHTQTPNSQHEGDFITLEGGGLSLGQGTTSVSGGCVWIRGLFLGQGAVSGSGGCLWAGVGMLALEQRAASGSGKDSSRCY